MVVKRKIYSGRGPEKTAMKTNKTTQLMQVKVKNSLWFTQVSFMII